MKSEFKRDAYRLTYEAYHFEHYGLDWSEDIEIVKFNSFWSGADTFSKPYGEPVVYPHPVIFTGDWATVQHIDFPSTFPGFPTCEYAYRIIARCSSVLTV